MATANTTFPRAARAGKPAASKRPARSPKRPAASTKTSTSTSTPAGSVASYTERAVLIPVGAALIARDRVVASVNDVISSYGSTTKAQAQLRKFERRGNTARNRLEREVRKARVRFERELRQRRRELEKRMSNLEERRDAVAKNVTELPNRVQERIQSLV